MQNPLKEGVRKLFHTFGYSVSRLTTEHAGEPSFAGARERLASRDPGFQSVIDVGAAVGRCSLDMGDKFPGRAHLLIEANAVHVPSLEAVCQKNRGWTYVLKACGPECGTIYFDGSDPFGGQAQQAPSSETSRDLPMTTIDFEVEALKLRPPYLIKLDTHGFELPILKGAVNTLQQTEVLVIEAYNFVVGAEAVRFWSLCKLLEEQGFLPIDMFDLLYRPLDRALWQMDIVFMRSSRPEFQDSRYR